MQATAAMSDMTYGMAVARRSDKDPPAMAAAHESGNEQKKWL